MLNSKSVLWMLLSVGVLTGCQSFTGFDFDSDALVGGGAVAGKDYITGLKPSLKAREYFVKSNANASQKKTVTPGDDQGTGVVWTDDGGIVIPPGCSIEFENKGYCLDPHLPAPGAGHEMQFVRIASLLPDELQGTYRNLLKRSAAGDEDVKNNMQRLVWALRTAGSLDVMATHLTDRQREILSECAEDGSFEDFVYRHELYGKIVEELKSKFINNIKDKTSVNVGGVVYDALDLLNPDTGKQKVEAHLQSLISMGLNLPVTQTGFNYGELENGIFTDIKGNGSLSFKAKIANSTSQPYTFYPMNYAAQVGSGGSSVGLYAAANSGMRQRVTIEVPEDVESRKGGVEETNTNAVKDRLEEINRQIEEAKELMAFYEKVLEGAQSHLSKINEQLTFPDWIGGFECPELLAKAAFWMHYGPRMVASALSAINPKAAAVSSIMEGEVMVRRGLTQNMEDWQAMEAAYYNEFFNGGAELARLNNYDDHIAAMLDKHKGFPGAVSKFNAITSTSAIGIEAYDKYKKISDTYEMRDKLSDCIERSQKEIEDSKKKIEDLERQQEIIQGTLK